MSDYARLMEENAVLKQQIADNAAGATTALGVKSSADAALKSENDRFRAALEEIADGGETKGDMKVIASKALSGK